MGPTASPPPPRDPFARTMFWLAFIFLLLLAGLLHRYSRPELTEFERRALEYGLILLWPVFAVEAIGRFLARDRTEGTRNAASRALLVTLLPPMRMGVANHTQAGPQLWLPFAGWRRVDKALAHRLDQAFGVPMIGFAFLILPLLILEYAWAEQVTRSPGLALFLHLGIAVVWVAFALELILKISVAPSAAGYARDRWLDVAIVMIPMLEFALKSFADAAPLARLLRLSRALQPEQISRMGQLYRLQGLAVKAWHAFLLLEVVARLTGHSLEKRLQHLEEQKAMKEAELAELQEEIAGVRAKIEDQKRDEVESYMPF